MVEKKHLFAYGEPSTHAMACRASYVNTDSLLTNKNFPLDRRTWIRELLWVTFILGQTFWLKTKLGSTGSVNSNLICFMNEDRRDDDGGREGQTHDREEDGRAARSGRATTTASRAAGTFRHRRTAARSKGCLPLGRLGHSTWTKPWDKLTSSPWNNFGIGHE